MKTHQPYHTIPKGASDATACKYIYVARNPKDVVVSYYKFESKMAPLTGYSGPFEFFAKMFLEGKSKLIKTRSIEKALNQHQFNHPTAVSDQFSLPDHSINDIELILFEHKDSVRKAREGFLISVAKHLNPVGGTDEMKLNLLIYILIVTSLHKNSSIVFLHQSHFIFIYVLF